MGDLGNKQIMAANIRRLMRVRNMNVADLSRALGISYTTVADWVNGKTYPRIDRVEAMANLFKVEKKDLVEEYSPMMPAITLRAIPVFSCISCGTGAWIDERPEDYCGVPDYMMFAGESFANPAEGDSMEPGIKSGDLLVFQVLPEVESGLIGAFSLNGVYYCKRFKKLADGSCWLFSDNSDYDPIPITKDDDFRVLGKYRLKLSKEQ